MSRLAQRSILALTGGRPAICMLRSVLAAGLLAFSSTARADLSATSCNSFDLGFSQSSVAQVCSEGALSSGWTSVERKLLQVSGFDYLLVAVFDVAGARSYFEASSPQEVFESLVSSSSSHKWSGTTPVHGYDTATFKLYQKTGSDLDCFAFVRYEDIPRGEFEGHPGNLKRLFGYYCSDLLADSQRGSEVIERVLEDLRQPGSASVGAPAPSVTNPAPMPPKPSAAGTSSLPSNAEVPFTVNLGGNAYQGVAQLKDHHLAGQAIAFGKPINLTGDVRDNWVSVELSGNYDLSPAFLGSNCVANGTAYAASGRVDLSMVASCGNDSPRVVLHMDLPASQ